MRIEKSESDLQRTGKQTERDFFIDQFDIEEHSEGQMDDSLIERD
jgi:hypothetical protein